MKMACTNGSYLYYFSRCLTSTLLIFVIRIMELVHIPQMTFMAWWMLYSMRHGPKAAWFQSRWMVIAWMVIYKIHEHVYGIHGASRSGWWPSFNYGEWSQYAVDIICNYRYEEDNRNLVEHGISDQEGSHVDDEGSAQRMKMAAVLERSHVLAWGKFGEWYGHLCYSLRYMRRGGIVATMLDTNVSMPSYRV